MTLVSLSTGRGIATSICLAAALVFGLNRGESGEEVKVVFTPAHPSQGALIRISLFAPGDSSALEGSFADEPLHFERGRNGGPFMAIAAVPVDAPSSVLLEVQATDDATGHRRYLITIAKGHFPVQRLRVAGEYGREPGKAAAARIAAESEKARQVSMRSHRTVRMWELPFMKPVAGEVSSRFGTARVFNGQVKSRHTGVDFRGAMGAPVRAANVGIVAIADRFYLGGNCIYIDHGTGLVTAYMHLSKIVVNNGDRVKKGQLIGRIGATGRATGPHLHWIARYGRISFDGLALLQLKQL